MFVLIVGSQKVYKIKVLLLQLSNNETNLFGEEIEQEIFEEKENWKD